MKKKKKHFMDEVDKFTPGGKVLIYKVHLKVSLFIVESVFLYHNTDNRQHKSLTHWIQMFHYYHTDQNMGIKLTWERWVCGSLAGHTLRYLIYFIWMVKDYFPCTESLPSL